jgi:carboxylesterase type B
VRGATKPSHPCIPSINGTGSFIEPLAESYGRVGSGAESGYDGVSLVTHGVILVTINYRLGVMGFLAHPEHTAESPHRSSGNYVLLDRLAALEWVRKNIAQFGGDPGNVTPFGKSAGSVDATTLMASPLAKGFNSPAHEGFPLISSLT